jgi:hypothetical protein
MSNRAERCFTFSASPGDREHARGPADRAESLLTTRHQPSGCLGVAARKKSDAMPLPHEFLGEVEDDAFGAAIEALGGRFR